MIRNVILRGCRDDGICVSERIRFVAWLSDDCRDGGICVFSADMQVLLLRTMVAETAEYICFQRAPAHFFALRWFQRWRNMHSVRIRNVLAEKDVCRDDGICVFSGSEMFVNFTMVAEMTDLKFSARIRNVLLHSDLADMVEYSFSARMAECVFEL